MIKLLDVCKIGGKAVKDFEGEKKYIATGDIIDNQIVSFEKVTYKNKPSRANVLIDINDVIFAKMQNTIKVLKANENNITNIYSTGFYSLTPGQNLSKDFLYYFLNSKSFNSQKDKNCSGATQKALNNEGLEKILIKDLPSMEEQLKIVKKLSLLDELVNYKKNEINKLEELIKSQFVEMFGDVKNSKYKKDYLSNLTLKITDGKHGGCKSENNSGYYFIGATEIYNNKINYDGCNQITEEDFNKDYKRCDLQKNDFVIVNTGATIGKSAIVTDDRCYKTLLQKSVALIRTDEKNLLPLYLKYCYDSESSLYNVGQGCARVNLLLSQIRKTLIPVPPIKLQNKFSNIVKQIDKQKFEFEKQLEKLEELQASLMQEYFG